MSGLRRICKLYGGMTVNTRAGTIRYVWDYAKDEPVTEREMPFGSDRHKASERARWLATTAPHTSGVPAAGAQKPDDQNKVTP